MEHWSCRALELAADWHELMTVQHSVYISQLVRRCFYQRRCITSYVKPLPTDVARTVVNSFVVNILTTVTGAPRYQPAASGDEQHWTTPLWTEQLRPHQSCTAWSSIHWLPVPQRIQYRLCLLVCKALCGLQGSMWSVTEADWDHPRTVTSSLSRLQQTLDDFLRCVCTTGMEPASSRHQEPSVAGVVQIQTQDSSVELQSLTLTNMTLTLMQCLPTVRVLVMV